MRSKYVETRFHNSTLELIEKANEILNNYDAQGYKLTLRQLFYQFVSKVHFRRLALNMDQIRKFNPPPNPTKLTDTRARAYIAEYGNKSWELDALEPEYLTRLISGAVLEFRNEKAWEEAVAREEAERAIIAHGWC